MSPPVLIGFADSLAAIESAWCLSDEGFEVHVFAREGGRPALARSKAVSVVGITPPEQDVYRSVRRSGRPGTGARPAAVLPLDDHSVWLCDRARDRVFTR